jgi:hypothetical protein
MDFKNASLSAGARLSADIRAAARAPAPDREQMARLCCCPYRNAKRLAGGEDQKNNLY